MRHLLRSLLDFTGQHRPHYEAVQVHDLIRRNLIFIGREAAKQGVEVAVSLAPSLPPCQLDVRVFKRALLNLLKNALEAMPHGGRLSIRTRMGSSAPCGGDVVIIEIQDTGAGIEEAELRKVFRPLYSTKPRGTGLGLPFCRQVIEEHGGEIHLTSKKGHGSTVKLMLPVHQEETGTK
jgi:signal transduction histidine kinase